MTRGRDGPSPELCELCLQALVLNDAQAEASRREAPIGLRPTLAFTKFEEDRWHEVSGKGMFYQYKVASTVSEGRDPPLQNRIASMAPERAAMPPALYELAGTSFSGAGDCQFCHILRDVFTLRYRNEPWWFDDGALLRFCIRYDWSQPAHLLDKISVTIRYPEIQNGCIDVIFFAVAAWPSPCQEWLRIPRQPLVSEGPLSHANVRTIKRWLEDCETKHTNCKAVIDRYQPFYVRRRLIHLRAHNSQDGLALLEFDEVHSLADDDMRYAALSYCWGETLAFMTKSESIAVYKSGIHFTRLPIVFQEAITVARTLDIHYLWIDAVCIVQDDLADWERESVQMPYIFAYAFVTICATASLDCDHSFLQRSAIPVIQVPFQSTLRPDIQGQYSIPTQPQHIREMEHDLELSRWHSRAWVYQEKRLASRLIIFGETMLQLQCREHRQLENGSWDLSHGWVPDTAHNGDHLWDIHEYSKKKLTFRRDRLNAVSGIARLISRSLDDIFRPKEYLAGLWFDPDLNVVDEGTRWSLDKSVGGHFAGQMCWKVKDPTGSFTDMMNILKSEDTYCAPSWSWASREEQISHVCPVDVSQKFTVLRWELPPLNLDAMIAVKPGSSITLQGVMRMFSIRPPRGTLNITNSRTKQTDYHFDWIRDPTNPIEERSRLRLKTFIVGRKQYDHVYGLLLLSIDDDSEDEQFFDMAAPRVTVPQYTFRMRHHYRRVGIFESQGDYRWIDSTPQVEVTII